MCDELEVWILVERNLTLSRFDLVIVVPPEEVYRVLTVEGAFRAWLCDIAEVDPRPGGRIYLWWERGYETSGTYTEVERYERVAFTWRGRADVSASEMRIKLQRQGDGTILTLEQHGDISTQWSQLAFRSANGLQAALKNLKSVLETGVDLRVAQRPLLGISEGYDLDDTLAERLGVTPEALSRQLSLPPGAQGFVVDIAVEGLPAHRAGLHRNDVLVRLAGREYSATAKAERLLRVGYLEIVFPISICSQRRSGLDLYAIDNTHIRIPFETIQASYRNPSCAHNHYRSDWYMQGSLG